MIKRIVEVSNAGTHLSVRLGQLIVKQDGQKTGSIPCEDVGLLLVDHQGVSYTHSVFTELLRYGAAVVVCNGQHHPAGMLLPIESNTLQCERFREQIQAKEPLKKRLWQQIVKAKISHQAKLVKEDDEKVYRALKALCERVHSGDVENVEAQASRKFWPVYSRGLDFRRQVDGEPPNNLLNYGYMVMRAAIARAICGAGLLATLGIHHRNRYNAYCLADDISEPFRGFVERRVRDICKGFTRIPEMDQPVKAAIIEVLYEQIETAGYKGPLMVGLHRTMASLQKCFAGSQKRIELPKL